MVTELFNFLKNKKKAVFVEYFRGLLKRLKLVIMIFVVFIFFNLNYAQ